MDRNLSTFNFRVWPKAAIGALLIILFLEGGSFAMLKTIEKSCEGGDLIFLDSDIFCRELSACRDETHLSEKYKSKRYKSWTDIKEQGPYDVIVFGSSVGNTGWVEMLKEDYGHNVLNMTPYRKRGGRMPEAFTNIINNYEKINGDHKSLLLHVDITERAGLDFRTWDNIDLKMSKEKKLIPSEDRWRVAPFKKLLRYIQLKKEATKVGVMNIAGNMTLFDFNNIVAISEVIPYTVNEYQAVEGLIDQFKDLAQDNKSVFAIITYPTKYQQYEWLLKKDSVKNFSSLRQNKNALKLIAQTKDIPFLDVEDILTPIAKNVYKNEGKLLWSNCDSHVNEGGVRYTAQIVDKFITEIYKEIR